jgi:hypothetical protein
MTLLLAWPSALAAQPLRPREPAAGAPGRPGWATLPLRLWLAILDELSAAARRQEPRLTGPAHAVRQRSLGGTIRKGLLSATLVTRFEVLESPGWVQVPIIDATASLKDAVLDGAPASLVRQGDHYAIGVSRPGLHELKVQLFIGQEEERFTRRVRFRLPPEGPTRIALEVPEPDVEVRLAHGVIVRSGVRDGVTALEGHLDATGEFDLTWRRQRASRRDAACRLEAQVHGRYTVQETVITGVAVLDVTVREGETDRLALDLPAGMEVLRVTGDAVQEWQSGATGAGRLTVGLRHLLTDRTRLTVHFQVPADLAAPLALGLPTLAFGATQTGALGVQVASGLQAKVVAHQGQPVDPRDLPEAVTELSPSPLAFGLRFTGPPRLTLSVTRHRQVELTGTVVDELEASTVILADGRRLTKLRLHLRNNTRQYLTVRLPPGARLTQSLIDGQPSRPARTRDRRGEALLFPLRQSERVDDRQDLVHVVRESESLGSLSLHYYSNPARWPLLLETNRDVLKGNPAVRVGMRLRIPQTQGVRLQESCFVVELAYERRAAALGAWGTTRLALPSLDVDAFNVTWHLYLPRDVEPLSMAGDLTQVSGVRYDLFRRLGGFLHRALAGRDAWAGGKAGRYQSILDRRKGIFQQEAQQTGRDAVVLASFPLVGQRYRFRRVLGGQATPHLTVHYVSRTTARGLQGAALGLAALLAFLWLWLRRRALAWGLAGVGLLALLVLAHHVSEVHRRIVWGLDLGLLVAVLLQRAPGWWQGVRRRLSAPWELPDLLSLRLILALAGLVALLSLLIDYPAFLGIALAGVLVLLHRWSRPSAEVSHA